MAHRILIADDDAEITNLLSRYLGKALGYEVTCVPDGEGAVEAAMNQDFDLCILDVRMPNLSGSETYMRLKRMQPSLEAIFFTADAEFEHNLDFLRFSLPAERVLKKPVGDLSILTRLIISILGPPAATR